MKSRNKVKGLLLILAAVLVVAVGVPASADQLILNPNGVGDQTELTPKPDLTVNWEDVADNDDATWVENGSHHWFTDLYELDDVTLTGTINSVTIYITAMVKDPTVEQTAKTVIKVGTTVDEVLVDALANIYVTRYTTYPNKPGTTDAWTWSDINALQVGVSLTRAAPGNWSRCTKVWVVVDYTPEECEWIGETAWAAGTRYVTKGNWATYTSYEGEEKEVTLYAGKTMEAGMVKIYPATFDPDNYINIEIHLNSGWRFADIIENLKIQDYESAPSGNPAPGGFRWKFDIESNHDMVLIAGLEANNFYGVHVDVEWEYCEESQEEEE